MIKDKSKHTHKDKDKYKDNDLEILWLCDTGDKRYLDQNIDDSEHHGQH